MKDERKQPPASGVGSKRPVLDKDAHLYPYLQRFGGVEKYGKQPSTPEKFEDVDDQLYN